MTVELPPADADDARSSIAAGSPADVDERWAACLANGAAHERAAPKDATRVRAIFVVTHEGSRVEATMVRRARG